MYPQESQVFLYLYFLPQEPYTKKTLDKYLQTQAEFI